MVNRSLAVNLTVPHTRINTVSRSLAANLMVAVPNLSLLLD
jgi:hypothetical protein